MKITQITEDTYENISIIKDIVDYILATLPDVIPENSVYVYGRSNNDWSQNPPNVKSIKELIEENKNNKKIVNALIPLMNSDINFYNDEKHINHHNFGDYSWGPINIFVSRIQSSTNTFVIRQNETYGYPNRFHNRVFRTLFHELRHLFQDSTYAQHMRKQIVKDNDPTTFRPWGEQQVEWDAKWSDILYHFDPVDFNTAQEYAVEVMEDFLTYVKISDKVRQHYYKKTIAYYTNFMRKRLEKIWEKQVRVSRQYIIKGVYDKTGFVNYTLEDLTWANNSELPPAIKNYYKIKTIKYFEEVNKHKNKLNQMVEKYKQEYSNILENFLAANNDRIKDINIYGASSAIVNKLMDNHPDFFYSKNKAIYDISYEVNRHYYRKTVDSIKHLKELRSKN